jgi:GT2 family glycosyltransferase
MLQQTFPNIQYQTYVTNKGFSAAVNDLIHQVEAEYFLILHPDIELYPDTIERFLSFFSYQKRAGILGGNLLYPDGTPNPCEIMFPGLKREIVRLCQRLMCRLHIVDTTIAHRSRLEWSHKKTETVNWVWNACMFIRREVFEQIGFFDESFFVWFADWDFCHRARKAGWDIYYVKEATVVHHERKSDKRALLDKKETMYKVDGWHSLAGQVKDQHVFLRKHASRAAKLSTKILSFLENGVKCSFFWGAYMLKNSEKSGEKARLKACLEVLHAIIAS